MVGGVGDWGSDRAAELKRSSGLGEAAGARAEVMLSVSPPTRVYLRPGATDLRGGFERLYQLARTCFGQD